MVLISVPTPQEAPEDSQCMVRITFNQSETKTFFYPNRHAALEEYVQAGKLMREEKDFYIRCIERARTPDMRTRQSEPNVGEALGRTISFNNPSLELPRDGLANSIIFE